MVFVCRNIDMFLSLFATTPSTLISEWSLAFQMYLFQIYYLIEIVVYKIKALLFP